VNIGHFLFAAAVTMAASAAAIAIAKKLELGSIVALLIVGMALGPHSPAPLFTEHIDEMKAVGEIGVMLLMFTVGLDIRPESLWSLRRWVFGLGGAQYAATTAAIFGFFAAINGVSAGHWQSALIASLALAMSSDAIALPVLQERGESTSTHGRAVVAIDVLQSFMVVPVLAFIPILGANAASSSHGLDVGKTLQIVAAVAGVYVLGRFALPWALTRTARDIGPSGFAAVVLAGVFFAGWWMESVGVSMALGAFMIGILLSTSGFSDQIKGAATRARLWLMAIFFIAIGMAMDLKQVVALKGDLLLYLPALLAIKFAVVVLLARSFGLRSRPAILTAALVMPFDEIGYVIFASANANGLIGATDYTVGLTMISFSFIVSPLIINLAYRLSERLPQAKAESAQKAAPLAPGATVVVAGYGYVGRAICAVLERAHIAYVTFETNPEFMAKAPAAKHNVRYGDLTDPALMVAIAIAGARLVIVASSDYQSSKIVLGNLQRFYPQVPVMTAVQYLAQRDELRAMGATEVVALAPEGTLSFACAALVRLGIASSEAEAVVDSVKAQDYVALRGSGEPEPQSVTPPPSHPAKRAT
jgi:glutathione-regulated potassium-efflux system protein KefB